MIPSSVTLINGTIGGRLNSYSFMSFTDQVNTVADSLEIYTTGDNIESFFLVHNVKEFNLEDEVDRRYVAEFSDRFYNTCTSIKRVSGYEPKDGEGEYIPITIHCDKGSVWDVTASCWDWVTVVYN